MRTISSTLVAWRTWTMQTMKEQTSCWKSYCLKSRAIERIQDSQSAEDEVGQHRYNGTNGLNKDVSFDLEGQSIVPGLIDAHTHLLWAGDRSREVGWRRKGKPTHEIANMGGGIRTP